MRLASSNSLDSTRGTARCVALRVRFHPVHWSLRRRVRRPVESGIEERENRHISQEVLSLRGREEVEEDAWVREEIASSLHGVTTPGQGDA